MSTISLIFAFVKSFVLFFLYVLKKLSANTVLEPAGKSGLPVRSP